jgi:hypothetical protein
MIAVNPLRGEAALQAGGKTYRLVFDANAFCFAESALAPMATDEIIGQIAAGTANMGLLRAMVWAALQRHHPETHIMGAGEVMSDAGMPAVRTALASGLGSAFGLATEGKDGKNPPKKEGGTGSGSSESGAKRGSNPKRSGGKPRA